MSDDDENLTLLDLLAIDHHRLRSLTQELRHELEKTAPGSEALCLTIFRTLKALLAAHAKAEEYTLYALFDLDKKCRSVKLRHFALEGYEEHDLMDKLLKEMGQAEEIGPQWRAQFTVLTSLLEPHLREEEKSFFPQVAGLLSATEMRTLSEVYRNERDQVFAKKSGMEFHSSGLLHVASWAGSPALSSQM